MIPKAIRTSPFVQNAGMIVCSGRLCPASTFGLPASRLNSPPRFCSETVPPATTPDGRAHFEHGKFAADEREFLGAALGLERGDLRGGEVGALGGAHGAVALFEGLVARGAGFSASLSFSSRLSSTMRRSPSFTRSPGSTRVRPSCPSKGAATTRCTFGMSRQSHLIS